MFALPYFFIPIFSFFRQFDDTLKLMSLIGGVYPLYAHSLSLILLLEKHKSIFILDIISLPSTIFTCDCLASRSSRNSTSHLSLYLIQAVSFLL